MKKLTMSDFFTTFVEANWCLVIGMYLVVFIFSWAFFGTVWFAIFWLRFRFDSGVTCVDNVDSWTSAFLLSVETQTTIGYGGRQVWRSCSSPSSFLHFSCELKQARGEHEGRDMPKGSSTSPPPPAHRVCMNTKFMSLFTRKFCNPKRKKQLKNIYKNDNNNNKYYILPRFGQMK